MKLPICGSLLRLDVHDLFSTRSATPRPFRRSARDESRRAARRRHKGLSRASVKFWRTFAHGTTPGQPGGVLRVWPKWERLAHAFWPTIPVPAAPYGTLQMRLRPHTGDRVVLPDGSVVETNAMVCELHCSNLLALRLGENRAIRAIRACREDLHSLACWVRQSPAAADFVALYGTTLLTVAALRLGFMTRESPYRIRRCLDRFFMIGLLLMYTDSGLQRLTQGTTLSRTPMEIWMSRDRLIELYGGREGQLLNSTGMKLAGGAEMQEQAGLREEGARNALGFVQRG
jgi:hypothetical protein